MGNYARTFLRVFLIAGAVLVSVLNPLLWIPLGVVAGGLTARIMSGPSSSGRSRSRKEEKEKAAQEKKNKAREVALERWKYYSPANGWKQEALPYSLTVRPEDRLSARARLDVSGVRDAAFVSMGADGALFSVPLVGLAEARNIEEFIKKKKLTGSVVRTPSGKPEFVSDMPEEVVAVVEYLHPSKDVTYSRTVTHGRQYIVEGCASYDEAVEKFRNNPDGYRVRNVFASVEEKTNAEGVKDRTFRSGAPLTKADIVCLPTGAYVITETSVTEDSALVRVPGDIQDGKGLMDFASKCLADESARTNTVTSKELSDGTPEDIERIDVELKPTLLDDKSKVLLSGLYVDVGMLTGEELEGIISEGRVPAGSACSVGSEPVRTSDIVLRMHVDDPAEMKRLAEECGVPSVGKFLTGSHISELKTDTRLDRFELSVGGASVPVSLLAARMANTALEPLAGSDIASWCRDASLIDDVSASLVGKGLLVKSVVEGVEKTELFPMKPEEIAGLGRRMPFSDVELKDFLIRTHPAFFKTYTEITMTGVKRSVFRNPAESLITGRRPERRKSVENVARKVAQKMDGKKTGRGMRF